MTAKFSIKLSKIGFTYHIDYGNNYFAQSLPMEVPMDVLTKEQQKEVKQKIFEALSEGRSDCILEEE